MLNRIERDEYGEMNIPLNAYYGIRTLRYKENFTVTKFKIPKQMIKSLAFVKKACALANYDAKRLSIEKIRAICSACDEVINGRFNNQFITDAVQGGSCTAFNVNMNEVLSNRATEMLGGKLGEYNIVTLDDVNLFQAPNDVVPTAAKHSMIVLSKPLLVEMKKLLKAFQDKAKKYKKVLKVGRNHLQDDMPISFGQLFGSMASTINRDIKRLNETLDDLRTINLGTGSIGVAFYSDDDYVENIIKRVNEFTEDEFHHPDNMIDDSRNLDEFVNLSHTFKLIAINISKTASDIRLMASGPTNGYNEINLPEFERQSGLSTGQSTQSIPEIVNQVCFQLMGKDLTISLAAEHGQLEVNAFASIVFPNLFDCFEYLTRALKIFREYCVEGMTVNEEVCHQTIENSKGMIAALLGKVDYDVCIEILRIAALNKLTIREACQKLQILPEDKLNKLLKIENIKVSK